MKVESWRRDEQKDGQTGDVGGNNGGVGGYLYLYKCRWAQGKESRDWICYNEKTDWTEIYRKELF